MFHISYSFKTQAQEDNKRTSIMKKTISTFTHKGILLTLNFDKETGKSEIIIQTEKSIIDRIEDYNLPLRKLEYVNYIINILTNN